MNIYVSHASSFNYKADLYEPLRELLQNHHLILPHEQSDTGIDARKVIDTCDLVIADVSYPSTGQGIELAWAVEAKRRILAFYREGTRPTSALAYININPIEYSSVDEIVTTVNKI